MDTDRFHRQLIEFRRCWPLADMETLNEVLTEGYLATSAEREGIWPEALLDFKTALLTAIRERKGEAPLHISEVEVKTAGVLRGLRLWNDEYHNAIKAAADMLCNSGQSQAVYSGRFTSGRTVWMVSPTCVLYFNPDGTFYGSR